MNAVRLLHPVAVSVTIGLIDMNLLEVNLCASVGPVRIRDRGAVMERRNNKNTYINCNPKRELSGRTSTQQDYLLCAFGGKILLLHYSRSNQVCRN